MNSTEFYKFVQWNAWKNILKVVGIWGKGILEPEDAPNLQDLKLAPRLKAELPFMRNRQNYFSKKMLIACKKRSHKWHILKC